MSSAKVTAEKVGGQFVKAYYQAVQNVEKKRLISFYNVVRSVPLFRLRSSPTPLPPLRTVFLSPDPRGSFFNFTFACLTGPRCLSSSAGEIDALVPFW